MLRRRRLSPAAYGHGQVVDVLGGDWGRIGGERARYKIIGRSLVGWGDGKASSGSYNLGLCPLILKVIETTPKGGYLPLNLYKHGRKYFRVSLVRDSRHVPVTAAQFAC